MYSPNIDADKSAKLSANSNVSTIYDPKDDNCPSSIGATNFHRNLDGSTNSRKTFLEHVKKLSVKLGICQSQSDGKSTPMKLFYCSFGLLVLFLILTASLMLIMRSPVSSNMRDIIVDGEFQVLNKPYQYEYSDKNATSYKQFSSSIVSELDRLFHRSEVSDYYNKSEILEVNTNMTVKCLVLFRNNDNINVGKIGLAFLRSLRLQHGHTWLGNYTINIQSIGFQIRGEEGEWGNWTEWNGCDKPEDHVATRTRKCYTKDSHQITNIDRCLLIPGNKGDLDIMPCAIFKALSSSQASNPTKNTSIQNSTTEYNTASTVFNGNSFPRINANTTESSHTD